MLAKEFDAAWRLALSDEEINADETPLHGCLLPDFQPVRVPLEAVAKLLRELKYIGHKPNAPRYDGEELENYRRGLVYPNKRVTVIPHTLACPNCGGRVNLSTTN